MYEIPLQNGWLRIQGNDLHTFLGGHGIFLHTALHQQAMEHHSLQYLSILLLSILAIFAITSAYLLTHFFNDHDHELAGKLRLWVGMERACPFFICFCFWAKSEDTTASCFTANEIHGRARSNILLGSVHDDTYILHKSLLRRSKGYLLVFLFSFSSTDDEDLREEFEF
jgi:hypothetical protein